MEVLNRVNMGGLHWQAGPWAPKAGWEIKGVTEAWAKQATWPGQAAKPTTGKTCYVVQRANRSPTSGE